MNTKLIASILIFTMLVSQTSVVLAAGTGNCPDYMKDVLKSYNELENAENFAKKKNKILKSTRFWETFMGRDISETEFRRAKLVSFIKESLEFDGAYIVIHEIEPMVHDVHLAYHTLKKYEIIEEQVQKVLEDLRKHPLSEKSDALLALRNLIYPNTIEEFAAKIEENDKAAIIRALENLSRENKANIIDHSRKIARYLDEYEAAFGFLSKAAEKTDRIGKGAQIVLDKLQSKYILKTFFERVNIPNHETPTIRELHVILEKYPDAQLHRLRVIRRREAISALLAFSPSKSIFRYLETVAAKIPGVSQSRVRYFLRAVEDERLQYLYYPDIERIQQSTEDADSKLHMAMTLNAGERNEFLEVYARRIDIRESWNELKEAARKKPDPTYLKKIEAAETAVANLDDMTLHSNPAHSRVAIRLLDLIIASILGYYGYSIVTDNEQVQDVKEEVKAQVNKVLPKNMRLDSLDHDQDHTAIDTLIDETEQVMKQADQSKLGKKRPRKTSKKSHEATQ